MIIRDTKIRVCYADTDNMGVVYYGNYPRFYEIGRNELIRELGISYKELEKNNILLPARSLNINYIKSAYYDDLLTVRTIVEKVPMVKFPIKTEIYNQKGELINNGEVVLAFFDKIKNKPCRPPKTFIETIEKNI